MDKLNSSKEDPYTNEGSGPGKAAGMKGIFTNAVIAMALIFAVSSCCPKITEQTTLLSSTIDTTELIRRTTEQIRFQDSVYFQSKLDRVMEEMLSFINEPHDKSDTVYVQKEKVIYKQSQGGTTATVSLYRDSLGEARIAFKFATDTLLDDVDSLRELTIRQRDSLLTVSTAWACQHYSFLKGGFGHWLRDILSVIALVAVVIVVIKKAV